MTLVSMILWWWCNVADTCVSIQTFRALVSRRTNTWLRLGVSLVGCGDCFVAAHGKFRGIFSKQMQSLVSIYSKYNTYALPLSNERCHHILVHTEGPINHISLSKCLDINSESPILHLRRMNWQNQHTLLNMDQNYLGKKTYPIQNMILRGACFLREIYLINIKQHMKPVSFW